MTKLATVILVAGAARRFGSCKSLAPINDQALIAFPLQAISKINVDTYIYTGFWHDAIQQHVVKSNWQTNVIFAPCWDKGIGDVIALVTSQLESDYDAILFMLADQPAVSGDNIELLLKVFDEHACDAVCCQYRDAVGVPAIAGKSMFEELKRLHGDNGAKHLLNDGKHVVHIVDINQCYIDIDTPEDLENYTHYLNNMSSLW
ncbi:nucleotidyltransferase family protein [Enterovibrio nigricans]|uniref:Molybdenum cofactor cytidylyltransferase n=1 Tax=Enterovibrio nigricans DSM 22720 TaxID=1121868 RepID=A0A1T4UD78_9GAMM|nr:nucleotidyltransferase family protein [Enterovibrio nigricans]PKF50719.1 nucleotidyltransferase family protein [Enterovibrio nigricans]SKA50715.1 molybdenum cofactor cytidylyltransferase [Enterovibrio nigricans DSM 22720]